MDDIIQRLQRLRSETVETIDLLRASRGKVEEQSSHFESPKAVVEYIDFFLEMLARACGDLERVVADLPERLNQQDVDALRQLASNAAAEQRRCLLFRDKWINRPLPYEDVRPLLNQVSVDSRDQLTAFRSLKDIGDELAVLIGPPPPASDSPGLDRRALFTRWFGK